VNNKKIESELDRLRAAILAASPAGNTLEREKAAAYDALCAEMRSDIWPDKWIERFEKMIEKAEANK